MKSLSTSPRRRPRAKPATPPHLRLAPITPLNSRRPKRVAVLGAGGFIGSHLIPALAARPDTSILAVDVNLDKLALTRYRAGAVEQIRARISEPGLLEDVVSRADVVVSLTAICNPALYNTQPLEVIDANYTDLVPLVKLCAQRRRRLVHFSTCEVYGRIALDRDGRRTRTMDEDTTALCLGPIDRERWSYAAAKQLLERVIWAHGRHAGLPFTIVRPFNVIGPRMDFVPGVDGEGIPRVLASFMHALLAGQDLLLVDGGRQRRSFVDVGEFVDATLRILDRPAVCDGQIVNLGASCNEVSIAGLARALTRAFRTARPDAAAPKVRKVSSDDFYGVGYDDSIRRIPELAKSERLLGWKAKRTLAEMLPGIVADYLARYEHAFDDRRMPRAVRGHSRP